MTRYIYLMFDDVFPITKTSIAPSTGKIYVSTLTIAETTKNAQWLVSFINKRSQLGDFIFVLSENPNKEFPANYLKALKCATSIKGVYVCKEVQTPNSIISIIDASLREHELGSFDSLKGNIILVSSNEAYYGHMRMRQGSAVLVEKNSDTYTSELDRLVNIAPDETDDARMRALVENGMKRVSLRRATAPPAPHGKKSKTEQSFLLFGSKSSAKQYFGVNTHFSAFTNDEATDDEGKEDEKGCCRCCC